VQFDHLCRDSPSSTAAIRAETRFAVASSANLGCVRSLVTSGTEWRSSPRSSAHLGRRSAGRTRLAMRRSEPLNSTYRRYRAVSLVAPIFYKAARASTAAAPDPPLRAPAVPAVGIAAPDLRRRAVIAQAPMMIASPENTEAVDD
jgi:hypothetical protein